MLGDSAFYDAAQDDPLACQSSWGAIQPAIATGHEKEVIALAGVQEGTIGAAIVVARCGTTARIISGEGRPVKNAYGRLSQGPQSEGMAVLMGIIVARLF
jgi:hypothetical protein